MEYTKGGWVLKRKIGKLAIIETEDEKVIALIPQELPEQVANAHLIAAAPELYEACKAYLDWLNKKPGYLSLNQIDNLHMKAIAKVEGGS